MSSTEHRKVDAANRIECHKLSTHAINQDPDRPTMTRHLVAEIDMKLKPHERKGALVDVFNSVGHVVFEVFESENHVANTSGRIFSLDFRGDVGSKTFVRIGFVRIAMAIK